MKKFEDLTGQTFNRWKVIGLDTTKRRRTYWICECQCELHTIKSVEQYDLIHGLNQSCGCYQKEIVSKINTKHGGCGTRLYQVWNNMKSRCYNPKNKCYKNYGARGIAICDEWLDFANFAKWAYSSGYQEDADYGKCTIERKNVNKGYNPENCCWADEMTQANNKTDNIFLEYKGRTQTLAQWVKELDIPYANTLKRIKNGYTVEEAFELPLQKQEHHFFYQDRYYTISELAEKFNINRKTLRGRLIRSKMSVEEALFMNPNNMPMILGEDIMVEHGQYILTYQNKTGNPTYWEEVTGIKKATIRSRAKKGWSAKDCLKEYVLEEEF